MYSFLLLGKVQFTWWLCPIRHLGIADIGSRISTLVARIEPLARMLDSTAIFEYISAHINLLCDKRVEEGPFSSVLEHARNPQETRSEESEQYLQRLPIV